MTTDLAVVQQLHNNPDLPERDHDAAQAVSDGRSDAKAANTHRVYQTAWHLLCEWTLLAGRQSMPAEPQTVALYLGHQAMENDPSPDDGQLHGEAHRGLNPPDPITDNTSSPPSRGD